MDTLRWCSGRLIILDQTRLPDEVCYLKLDNCQQVVEAIKKLQVRGAPAIGAAAAYGLVLAAVSQQGDVAGAVREAAQRLAKARPTAVNLFWALERMLGRLHSMEASGVEPWKLGDSLLSEANDIYQEDLMSCRRLSAVGNSLVPDPVRILTHCNAGALATVGYGTALGIVRAAWESGKKLSVYACETRPLLQGARLTAWELLQGGIPVTLITDSMAAYVMAQGKVDLVIVGADRIAANGDVANKIGTYSLAIAAQAHSIPFYVAAPWSTVDLKLAEGSAIPIEERDSDEVRFLGGKRIAPPGVPVYNPAFDVTPARLITAIVTDRGLASSPFRDNLCKLAVNATSLS